jgi:hypothetical protein
MLDQRAASYPCLCQVVYGKRLDRILLRLVFIEKIRTDEWKQSRQNIKQWKVTHLLLQVVAYSGWKEIQAENYHDNGVIKRLLVGSPITAVCVTRQTTRYVSKSFINF